MGVKCEGCGRVERCHRCGRFMQHWWAQATDEPDSWGDWWTCSQDAKHREEHPEDYEWGRS